MHVTVIIKSIDQRVGHSHYPYHRFLSILEILKTESRDIFVSRTTMGFRNTRRNIFRLTQMPNRHNFLEVPMYCQFTV